MSKSQKPLTLTLSPYYADAITRALKARADQLKDAAREFPGLRAHALDQAGELDALAGLVERAIARHGEASLRSA